MCVYTYKGGTLLDLLFIECMLENVPWCSPGVRLEMAMDLHMKHLVINHHYEQEQSKLTFTYSETFLKEHPLMNKFI